MASKPRDPATPEPPKPEPPEPEPSKPEPAEPEQSDSEPSGPEAPGAERSGEAGDPDPVDPLDAAISELAERETAYGLLRRGQALLRRRHHAQAAILLERAARMEPGKGSIVEALGRAYYNSGQHALAAEAFGELVEIDPSTAYGHFALGQSLKLLGRRNEARTHLRLAVALAPQSRLYRDALARLG